MPLFVTGVNHESAPVDLREQLSLSGEKLEGALCALRCLADEVVILSTCNRLEVYGYSTDPTPPSPLSILRGIGTASDALLSSVYERTGIDAAAHLYRVASGLDSLVLGEVQILGQVQRAWRGAHLMDTAGPVLSHLFHRAVSLGKRAHSETGISRSPASVSYAAVALARQIFGGELRNRSVLVVGTGEVGEGVSRCLYEHGVRPTVVAHRHVARAEELARLYGAELSLWEELPVRLAATDIVISSTAAPHVVLQRQHIEDAMLNRQSRAMHLIDLAVPRDIDPSAAQLPGVHLHNIDDLRSVVQATLEQRRESVPAITRMIENEVAQFSDWLKARAIVPALRRMRERAGAIAEQETAWALAKMPDLTERERAIIAAMSARIVGKALHEPTMLLKALARPAGEEYEVTPEQVSELFLGTTDDEETEAQQ